MIDLAELYQKPFGCFESSLGKLWAFACSMKDQTALSERLPLKLEDTSPENFVREFMSIVCFPDGSLKDGKSKPDVPVLTDSDLEKLTSDDLESFAKFYVDKNPRLVKRLGCERKSNAEGESFVAYLFRLTLLERVKQREQAKKMMHSFGSFSGDLEDSIRKNLAHGDSLQRCMENLQQEISAPSFYTEPRPPNIIDWVERQRDAEKARRVPFDDLANRLDRLVASSIESSKFMVDSNAIQAQVAEELKTSGDTASSFSRKNLWLSIAIIVLTVISLGITAYSTYLGSKQDAAWQTFSEGELKKLNSTLHSLSDDLRKASSNSQDILTQQLDHLQHLAEVPEVLGQNRTLTFEQLGALNAENSMLRAEVARLQARVQKLESKME